MIHMGYPCLRCKFSVMMEHLGSGTTLCPLQPNILHDFATVMVCFVTAAAEKLCVYWRVRRRWLTSNTNRFLFAS